MALTRSKKTELLEQYKQMFSESPIVVVAGYQGMSVAEMTEMRDALRQAGGEFHVVKNTLAKLALDQLEIESSEELWTLANGVAVTSEDAASAAKALVDYAKRDENFAIRAGFMGTNPVSSDDIKAIADLPSREVLLAQVLAGMQAPVTGIVMVMGGLLRGLVNVLDARGRQLEEAAAG